MTDFTEIFSDSLTTAVYVYGSIAFMIAYASAAVWLLRQPKPVALHWKFGRA